MRISDCSSDVCSSDLVFEGPFNLGPQYGPTDLGCVAQGSQMWGVDPSEVECRFALLRFGHEERSEERRVGKSVSVRLDLDGRRIIKKKHNNRRQTQNEKNHQHINTLKITQSRK